MAAIGPVDTAPEIAVRRALHRAGFRFRLHTRRLPGRPDIVLPKYQAVVFVHGCFWHHHSCANSVWPKARAAFWRAKIRGTMKRDARKEAELRQLGWRVFVVWECQTDDNRVLSRLYERILDAKNPLPATRRG